MKILLVSNFFPPSSSGSGIFCNELSKRLVEIGFEVTVLTSQLSKDLPKKETIEGVNVIRLRSLGVGWGISALCTPIPFLLKNAREYDLVHLMGYLFLMSNQTALIKRLKGFPMVLHLHGGLGIPNPEYVGRFKPFVKEYLYDPVVGTFTLKSAEAVLSVSKKDIEICEWKFGVRPVWVPNGVDTDVFKAEKKENGRIVFVGKLEKWKGALRLPSIAKGIKKTHDAELHIVGEGSLLNRLKEECRNLPVVFHGRLPHKKIPNVISTSEVLLLPSLLEGLPLVALESLACETPVVATDVGGNSEIIIDGETGFLVPPGDTDLFTERVAQILSDEGLRKKMGKNGRDVVKKHYSWDKIADQCIEVYKTIAN